MLKRILTATLVVFLGTAAGLGIGFYWDRVVKAYQEAKSEIDTHLYLSSHVSGVAVSAVIEILDLIEAHGHAFVLGVAESDLRKICKTVGGEEYCVDLSLAPRKLAELQGFTVSLTSWEITQDACGISPVHGCAWPLSQAAFVVLYPQDPCFSLQVLAHELIHVLGYTTGRTQAEQPPYFIARGNGPEADNPFNQVSLEALVHTQILLKVCPNYRYDPTDGLGGKIVRK